MTWNEIQKYIETLDDHEKEYHHIVLYDATRNVYYIVTDVVDSKKISKDPCLYISQL